MIQYEHPADLVEALLLKSGQIHMIGGPVLTVVAYKRILRPELPKSPDAEKKRSEDGKPYDALKDCWQQIMPIWLDADAQGLLQKTSNLAAVGLANLEFANVPEELREWGIRVTAGPAVIQAADLAPGLDYVGAVEAARQLAEALSAKPVRVHIYATGNGYHLYADQLGDDLGAFKEKLKDIAGVDQFWVANMEKSGHGVLRWSGGSGGREVPRWVGSVLLDNTRAEE